MKHFLFTLLVLLTGCLTAPTQVTMVTPSLSVNVEDLTAKAVALLEMEDGEANIFCSGVWVGPRTIATAEHCVRGLKLGTQVSFMTKPDMYEPGQLKEKARLVPWASELAARDTAHDVALLRVVGICPQHATARIAEDIPRQGSQVHTLGAPLGIPWTYSRGEVSAVRYIQDILSVQATAPISGGNSGGGLFNDAGELLGLCRATFTSGQNMNIFTHVSYVKAIL